MYSGENSWQSTDSFCSNAAEEDMYTRTRPLLGDEGLLHLQHACVLLFGLGGVGGYALEALVRAGVGRMAVVDADRIAPSNLNRQILAEQGTIGRLKTEVAAERAARIRPDLRIMAFACYADRCNMEEILDRADPDYIIDAIDSVDSKVALAVSAQQRRIPLISCMGTGNKLYPGKFRIDDIGKTHTCPLARTMRARLRAEGVRKLEVLWSPEVPRAAKQSTDTGRRVPASVSYVPGVAGLMLAGHVICRIAGLPDGNADLCTEK